MTLHTAGILFGLETKTREVDASKTFVTSKVDVSLPSPSRIYSASFACIVRFCYNIRSRGTRSEERLVKCGNVLH